MNDYGIELGGPVVVLDYDNFTETTFGSRNPNFGLPTSRVVAGPQYQTPLQVRLGIRYAF